MGARSVGGAVAAVTRGVAIAMIVMGAGATAAAAQKVERVVADTLTPKLTEGEDGKWTAAVVLTNLTASSLELNAQDDDRQSADCDPSIAPTKLPARQQTKVEVATKATCPIAGERFDFEIDAKLADGGAAVTTIPFVGGPKSEPATLGWTALLAFPIALGVLALLAALPFAWWVLSDHLRRKRPDVVDEAGDGDASQAATVGAPHDTAPGDDPAPPAMRPNTPLTHLDTSWSLKESWISNITLGTALVTGIFGSTEVVTAMLGEDAKDALAVVIVGAAAAAGLVAVGPLLLAATKTKTDKFSVGGLFAATVVVLAGALAELAVVADSAAVIDARGVQTGVWIAAVAVALLLLVYTFRNLESTLRTGITDPGKDAPSDTLVAAGLIVNALSTDPPKREISAGQVAGVVAALKRDLPNEMLTDDALMDILPNRSFDGQPQRAPAAMI